MNICFIGGGNMASAMIGGLLRNGTCTPSDIRVVEISEEARLRLKATYGVFVFDPNDTKAIEGSDVVVLAVKPQQMPYVARQLNSLLTGQIVLSIAAGIRLQDLFKWISQTKVSALVRAMPNTPALTGAGVTGLCSFPILAPGQREKVTVETIVGSIGTFVWGDSVQNMDEFMDAVTAVSGSGPAYFFYFIEALEEAGTELGLPQQTARKLALETAYGAAKLARESTEDPATLRARVTSKNGTTERALLSMESNHVKQHIMAAARAAAARSKELGDELGSA